jgi:hypothetical protein
LAEYGVNFRGADSGVSPLTDGANERGENGSSGTGGADITSTAAPLGGWYPQPHPGGFDVGWEQSSFAAGDNIVVRSRSGSGDIRTAGTHSMGSGETADYRIDSGTGTFDIRIAAGDRNYAQNVKLELFDNTSSVTVFFDTTTGGTGDFVDATGANFGTSAAWVSGNTREQHTISTGPMRFRLGANTAGNAGALNHISIEAVGGGQTISVGLSTETDSAFGVAWSKAMSVGLVGETDSAQAIVAIRTHAAAQAQETDSAPAVTHKKAVAVGLAAESDSAQTARSVRTIAAGLASETDSASAITRKKVAHVGLAEETDEAIGITSGAAVAVGLATENDSALAIARKKTRGVGLAAEASVALAVTAAKLKALGLAGETDSAFGIAAAKSLSAGLATETDSAFSVTRQKLKAVGLATEADEAFPLIPMGLVISVGLAAEIDIASPIAWWRVRRAVARTGGAVTSGGGSAGVATARVSGTPAIPR